MSNRKIITTTCLITFLVTSVLWMAVIGFFYWTVSAAPPAFQVDIDSPNEVSLGDSLELIVKVTNVSESDITLGSIDVYDTLLDGFELIEIEPQPSETSNLFGFHASYFSKKLAAQEKFTATYSLKATEEGLWIGDIDSCTPFENFVTVTKAIKVTAD